MVARSFVVARSRAIRDVYMGLFAGFDCVRVGENTSIAAILSECYIVGCVRCFLAMVDKAVIYLGHLKNQYVM